MTTDISTEATTEFSTHVDGTEQTSLPTTGFTTGTIVK